jgi:hypothetical protein
MNMRAVLFAAAMTAAAASAALPAAAQMNDMNGMNGGPEGVPHYRHWQAGWDNGQFDRRHVIVGTVADFHPYRLQIARANGDTETIDLKNGTAIFPTGMTPRVNQHVAVLCYYSNGTFIANRVILRG